MHRTMGKEERANTIDSHVIGNLRDIRHDLCAGETHSLLQDRQVLSLCKQSS